MTVRVEKCPTCGGDAVDRSFFWEAVIENGDEVSTQLFAIEKAIKRYFLALDRREHGDIAQDKAFREIQIAMGMEWTPGETIKEIEANPRLKKIYDRKDGE